MSASVQSPSVADFRARARAWLEEAEIPQLPAGYEGKAQILREWHRRLYKAGLVGITWPSEVGGLGLGVEHQLAFNEELARVRAPQPVGSIGLEVVGPTILKYGNDAQRERFVRPLLAGDEIWCQGFSEPNAGSDLASLRTAGVIDGDEMVVNGQKIWTSWATDADWCAVLVRTDRTEVAHRGISYVLVDMRSPGVSVKPIVMLNGDAEFNELFFDDVRVPLTNVLGPLHGGWKLAMDTLGWERAGYSMRRRIENEVVFRDLLDDCRAEAEEFSDAQAADLGRVYVQLKAFEALAARTAARLAAGEVPTPLDSVDKLWLTRTEQALTSVAFDLLGAARMAPRDAGGRQRVKRFLYGRAGSVYGGSSQIQRTLIAERLLGLPRGR
ncbi:MAG: acyl-CoA dehydrogenase [Rhodococcus sp. (in: high G+C Gram-positive bacteria)]|nr:MAG: acyl-CoA dehydrogenase [Rhodococcus sp. (in: high G+C Gram-positive bacteria)]